jgi:hypothetical protein
MQIISSGEAEYDVDLPPMEIGLYFETDWKEHNIVIKGIRDIRRIISLIHFFSNHISSDMHM